MAPSAAPPQATQVASISPVAISQSGGRCGNRHCAHGESGCAGIAGEDISGKPGSEIPLRIEVAQSDTEEYSFLMFRGLPADISLSAGFRLKDSWAVSLRDLANLALISPPEFDSRFQVEVLLIKGRNTPADSRVMNVESATGGSARTGARAGGGRQRAAASGGPAAENFDCRAAGIGAAGGAEDRGSAA